MKLGELRSLIFLLEPKPIPNDFGQPQTEHAQRQKAWAKVETLDTRDVARFRQAGLTTTALLTIRLNTRIGGDWQVDKDGLRYSIETISHSADRRWTMLTIFKAADKS